MSVYDLNLKGMRKAFRDFSKTLYGKTIFIIAYFIPMILFGTSLAFVFSSFINKMPELLCYAGIFAAMFIIMFMLSNAYYYSEVRKFCEHSKSTKKHKKA